MASGFWRKGSPEPPCAAWVARALVVLLGLLCRPAAADVELIPSSAGFIGAWELAGPYPTRSAAAIEAGTLTPSAGKVVSRKWGGIWQPRSVGDGALDLAALLGTGQRAGPVALAAGELVLSETFDGWLLLSADGSVDVYVDGKSIWSRESHRLRGSSWDAIPLHLEEGSHPIVLVLTHPGRYWAFETRFLDKERLRPPVDARWRLPGAEPRLAERLLFSMARVEASAGLDSRGFHPRVRVAYARGMPLGPEPPSVTVQAGHLGVSFDLGRLIVNRRGVHPLEASLPPWTESELPEGTRNAKLLVSVAGQSFETRLSVSRQAILLTRRAAALVNDLRDRSGDVQLIVRATTEWMVRELGKAADSPHAYQLAEAARRLEHWLDSASNTQAPFLTPGVHELAHYSDLTDVPEPFRVHVPQGFDPAGSREYPAVLALHGYNGSPQGIMEAFLDSSSRLAKAGVDGFVLAPMAHGNAFYRGPGEHEAMAVLDLAERVYPIDPSHVGITGVSMGGTGAAELALRYSDRFAAAAPLCGYHSYFIRRDTSNRPLSPWEKARMHHWSTSSWAANGRHLPLFVAHGTRDHPLENSKVLIRAYRELGQSVSDEWPETGHAVWKVSYRGARLWPWLTQHSRPTFPAHVTVRTDTLRYGTEYWVSLTRFQEHGTMGQIDARRVHDDEYALTTENVNGLSLLLPPQTPASTIRVNIDGQLLSYAPGEPVVASREGTTWVKPPPGQAGRYKKAGVEGPIRDVFLDRVTFVYGSGDESTRRANREVCDSFGRFHSNMNVDYPVLSDRELDAATAARSSLVLVGTPRDNAVLGQIDAELPIHARRDGIAIGNRLVRGDDVGAIFIHPNPEHPDHYVVVITAPSPAGIWRAQSLPRLLPDFLVYDRDLADAATEQVLGTAKVRAAGFFRSDWSLPSLADTTGSQ